MVASYAVLTRCKADGCWREKDRATFNRGLGHAIYQGSTTLKDPAEYGPSPLPGLKEEDNGKILAIVVLDLQILLFLRSMIWDGRFNTLTPGGAVSTLSLYPPKTI